MACSADRVGHAHGLSRAMLSKLPARIIFRGEVAQPVLAVQLVKLDEGFPVVIASADFDSVKSQARKVEVDARSQACEVACNVAPAGLEKHAVPLAQRRVAQVQAGIGLEARRGDQPACGLGVMPGAVCPAVQGTDDVGWGWAQVAAPSQDDSLPMATDIGDELDAVGSVRQCAGKTLMSQSVIVSKLRRAQGVGNVARARGE